MGRFSHLANDSIKKSEDRISSGGALETDIYELTIKSAHLENSNNSKAESLVISAVTNEGKQLTFTQWFTNKLGSNYTEKDGKKQFLMGWELIDDLCLVTTDYPFAELDFEDKMLEIWDYTAKAKKPKQVPVLMAVTNKKFYGAVTKVLEPSKDGTKTYEKNELVKVFHFPTKLTCKEAESRKEPAHFDAWIAANQGKVIDKTKNKNKASSSPLKSMNNNSDSSATTKSGLFG